MKKWQFRMIILSEKFFSHINDVRHKVGPAAL